MKLARNLTILSGATSLSLFTATYINFPELRDHKYQLYKAMKRLTSVIATSIKMGCIYKFNVFAFIYLRMILLCQKNTIGLAEYCWKPLFTIKDFT